MPYGTVPFAAFTASAPGVGGETIAQKASATTRPGVLGIDFSGSTLTNLTADTAAGMTLAELDLHWASASTGDNTFSAGYLSDAAALIADLQSHGYQVAVSAGIFSYPSWLSGYANWQYLDQNGAGSGSPNFVWNPVVRAKAAAYIAALQAAMVTAGVQPDYYRVGLAPDGETYLPATGPGGATTLPTPPGPGQTGSWWAFDSLAQGPSSGLPSGISTCPMQGWVPGTSGVTVTQATAWWDWYMGSVNIAHQWEMAAHQATGWNGCIMLVTPGRGLLPTVLQNRLGQLLGPDTNFPTDDTANYASYWPSLLSTVPNGAGTVLDISSVGNNDGAGGVNDVSGPGDQSLTLAEADPYNTGWSGVRWLAYLAGQNGNIPCLGESVGETANSGTHTWGTAAEVSTVMTQAKGCGLYAVMWANDDTLNWTGPGSPAYATPAEVVAGFNAVY